jgi:hypothetical protein
MDRVQYREAHDKDFEMQSCIQLQRVESPTNTTNTGTTRGVDECTMEQRTSRPTVRILDVVPEEPRPTRKQRRALAWIAKQEDMTTQGLPEHEQDIAAKAHNELWTAADRLRSAKNKQYKRTQFAKQEAAFKPWDDDARKEFDDVMQSLANIRGPNLKYTFSSSSTSPAGTLETTSKWTPNPYAHPNNNNL